MEQVTCQYLRSIALSSCARVCISMAVANFDAANIDFSNHTNINISGLLKCIHSFPLVVLWRKVTSLNMEFLRKSIKEILPFCLEVPNCRLLSYFPYPIDSYPPLPKCGCAPEQEGQGGRTAASLGRYQLWLSVEPCRRSLPPTPGQEDTNT